MGYSAAQVKLAIDGLTSSLGCGPSRSLQNEFEAGLHPTLLSYDRVELSQVAVPMLTRYLVGAASYLHQPANYYNIFSACRCVNMVQFLEHAVARLRDDHVVGLDTRLERLTRENKRDAFDAIAFELITAARYSKHEAVTAVEFIEESCEKTPDFLVRIGPIEMFVECKKIDRTQNFTMAVRNAARDLLNPVLSAFHSRNTSVLADVTFHVDPQLLSSSQLIAACDVSLRERTPIIESRFTVQVTRLPRFQRNDYSLYPSPKFWLERYRYRVRSEWIGVINQLYGKYVAVVEIPSNLQGGASTWLEEIAWDAAAKWKVSSDPVISKYRRFAFDGIFKGLEQIENRGMNSALHVWLESDYYTGRRQAAFMDLFNRLAANQRHHFGWLVINETLFDVSPKGVFDVIEHAHPIQGPTSITRIPLVTTVFVPDESVEDVGEFGVGVELPDIDQ